MRHLCFLLRSYPQLADRWGYHVRGIHYYEPLPDFREVTVAAIRRRRRFPAIDFDFDGQVALVRRLAAAFGRELRDLANRDGACGFDFNNDYFAGFDAAM
jgi:hypothetical protein